MRQAARLGMATAGMMAVALSPVASRAQFGPLAPVNPGDRITQLEIIPNVTYDSNVAGSDAALAATRHIKLSDVIFEPSARVELARPIGRQTLYLLGSFGYEFYARNGVLNRENIQINPGVLGEISRCEYDASGSYSRQQSQLSELAIAPGGSPPSLSVVKNVIDIGEISGGAVCGGSVGLAPTARVTQSWVRNSSSIQQGVNVNSFSTEDGVAYRRPSFGNLTLFGAYATTSYPDRSLIDVLLGLPAINAGYETYSGGISYTRPVGARLVGSVSLSYTDLINSIPGAKGFSGITYSAALNYSMTPRLTTSVNISRATLPSNRLNSTYKIDGLYSGEADYRLNPRATVKLGASYEHDSYGGYPKVILFDLTDEKIIQGFVGAEYRLNRLLSFGLDLQHSHREANVPGLTYDDTRATLGFRASF